MDLLLRLQPQPTTFQAALEALKLAEIRLTLTLKFIIRFYGQVPADLRDELGRASVADDDAKPKPKPKSTARPKSQTLHAKIQPLSSTEIPETLITEDELTSSSVNTTPHYSPEIMCLDDDDREISSPPAAAPSPQSSPSSPPPHDSTGASEAAAEVMNTDHGMLKIVDIRTITNPEVELMEINNEPVHSCKRCKAKFESVHALSVHNLLHARLRLKRLGVSKQSLKLVIGEPRLYSIRRLGDKMVVVKRTQPNIAMSKKSIQQLQVQCELCPRKFSSESVLNYHWIHIHKLPKPCEKCGLRFQTNRELTKHIQEEHDELICFQCRKCESRFLTRKRLEIHVAKVHPDPSEAVTCEVCGKFCKTQEILRAHLKTNHLDPSLAVTCEICGTQSKSATAFKTHMKIHTAPRSFLCQTCGFAARSKERLKVHLTSHSTARPYTCPHCPSTFKTRKAQKDHVNRHFGKNIKPCPYCGIEKAQNDLYNHIKIIHQGRKFKCAECPAMFSLRAHLKNHYTLKHEDVKIPADSDLEVIYTKNPEDTLTPVLLTRRPKEPQSDIPRYHRKGNSAKLICNSCPKAVFNTRDDYELHMLRHEKDPDYKLLERLPVQRLDPMPVTATPVSTQPTTVPAPLQGEQPVVQHQQRQYHKTPVDVSWPSGGNLDHQFPPQQQPVLGLNMTQLPDRIGENGNSTQYESYNPFHQAQIHQSHPVPLLPLSSQLPGFGPPTSYAGADMGFSMPSQFGPRF